MNGEIPLLNVVALLEETSTEHLETAENAAFDSMAAAASRKASILGIKMGLISECKARQIGRAHV